MKDDEIKLRDAQLFDQTHALSLAVAWLMAATRPQQAQDWLTAQIQQCADKPALAEHRALFEVLLQDVLLQQQRRGHGLQAK